MHRSSVDLPLPEAPIRHTTWCGSTSRSTPRSTSLLPKRLWTSRISRNAIADQPARMRAWSRRWSRSTKRVIGMVMMKNSIAAIV